MIHDRNNEYVSALDATANPFYLFITDEVMNTIPLPLAIKQNNQEACKWRDAWEYHASKERKLYCLFHPTRRNWVGEVEDSVEVVEEVLKYYDW